MWPRCCLIILQISWASHGRIMGGSWSFLGHFMGTSWFILLTITLSRSCVYTISILILFYNDFNLYSLLIILTEIMKFCHYLVINTKVWLFTILETRFHEQISWVSWPCSCRTWIVTTHSCFLKITTFLLQFILIDLYMINDAIHKACLICVPWSTLVAGWKVQLEQ